jgi:hypothetical protein
MAIEKERRAAPRKPPSTAAKPDADAPVTKRATPQREMPKREAEPASEVPSPEDLRRRIEMQAYFKAKARGFEPGYELEDWLQAEREVRQQQQR